MKGSIYTSCLDYDFFEGLLRPFRLVPFSSFFLLISAFFSLEYFSPLFHGTIPFRLVPFSSIFRFLLAFTSGASLLVPFSSSFLLISALFSSDHFTPLLKSPSHPYFVSFDFHFWTRFSPYSIEPVLLCSYSSFPSFLHQSASFLLSIHG